MKKKKETYKTNHPEIKEITIGDQFVTENGKIVTFIRYDKSDPTTPFRMDLGWYSIDLKFNVWNNKRYDIKGRIISLKDKINLL